MCDDVELINLDGEMRLSFFLLRGKSESSVVTRILTRLESAPLTFMID